MWGYEGVKDWGEYGGGGSVWDLRMNGLFVVG